MNERQSWAEAERHSWSGNDHTAVVSLIAPKNCGKTNYLAALQQVALRASYVVGEHSYRLQPLVSVNHDDEIRALADDHLRDVWTSIRHSKPNYSTASWFSFETQLEHMRGGQRGEQRDRQDRARRLFLLDALGGSLFPGRSAAPWHPAFEDPPSLRKRLEEHNLQGTEQHLLVFVNEPALEPRLDSLSDEQLRPDAWRMERHVPRGLAEYVRGVRFRRVVLYVACADLLFPRLGNLGERLDHFNRTPSGSEALARYLEHFAGSPHCDFARDFMRYLVHSGATFGDPEANPNPDTNPTTEVAVFWGSALGLESVTGRSNVNSRESPARLNTGEDWNPAQVLEPLLWLLRMNPGAEDLT